jgi:putative hydrolase of the HAD superfamily
MQEIRAITFDAGGTLLYPYPSVGEIYCEILAKHGVIADHLVMQDVFFRTFKVATQRPRLEPHDAASEKRWWYTLVRETLADFGEPDDYDAFFAELWDEFAHPSRWRLYDGARDVLDELAKRGYRLALLSNWDDRLRPLLTGMGVHEHFESMIISCEVGAEKPASEIFTAAERALGLPGHQILHIGDSEHHDLRGAEAMGWRCLLIEHGREESEHLTALAELLELLPGCRDNGPWAE